MSERGEIHVVLRKGELGMQRTMRVKRARNSFFLAEIFLGLGLSDILLKVLNVRPICMDKGGKDANGEGVDKGKGKKKICLNPRYLQLNILSSISSSYFTFIFRK